MSNKQTTKVEEDEKKEEEEETEAPPPPKEPELPPEVDAFFKGKNKYKHPYGDWKPVVKTEPLKRLVLILLVLLIALLCFLVKHLANNLIYQRTIGIYRKINQRR